MLVAHRLSRYSYRCKFSLPYFFLLVFVCLSNARPSSFMGIEATRHRALVSASAAECKKKEKEEVSSSAPKVVGKGASKQKSKGKDNRPLKKGPVTSIGDKLKKSSPPKPSHRAGKGLEMAMGPVTQGTSCHLLTHKGYAIEVLGSIIKETDLDPCSEQETEDLGASGLFDLSRVCSFLKLLLCCPFVS